MYELLASVTMEFGAYTNKLVPAVVLPLLAMVTVVLTLVLPRR